MFNNGGEDNFRRRRSYNGGDDDEEEDDFNPQKHFEDFADQSQLSPRVRRHLSAMYGHLAVTALLALMACWMQINGVVEGGGLLPALGGVAALWSMQRIANPLMRQLILYGFGFMEGLGLAPLVDTMYYLQPEVLLSALVTTFLIFVGFTGTALLSSRRSYLYLGGLIGAGMIILLSGSIFGAFFNSTIVDNVVLYVGLLVFAMLITFDTQMIVERVETARSVDPVFDAANMLINVVGILRRILIIMAQQRGGGRVRRRHNRKK